MKTLYVLLLAGITLLIGCDSIDSDHRFIEVPAATIQRNVLIEDFTGQRCIYCPQATEAISQLQATYGADKLIAVAIHAGPLALQTTTNFVGLRTDVGDTYYQHWAIPNVPKAIFDRRGGALPKEAWPGQVYEEFNRTTTVGIELKCQYTTTNQRVEIETDLKTLTNDIHGLLQLWLVEDGIVAPQLFPNNKLDKNYIHHHVLRAAINGDWGKALTLFAKQAHKELTTYTLPQGIKPDKAWIVAFFYNESGVLQVTQHKITQP